MTTIPRRLLSYIFLDPPFQVYSIIHLWLFIYASLILMNCYQWGSCLFSETSTEEPMELPVINNFYNRWRPRGGSNSAPFDPNLNDLITRPRTDSLKTKNDLLSVMKVIAVSANSLVSLLSLVPLPSTSSSSSSFPLLTEKKSTSAFVSFFDKSPVLIS